MVEVSFDEIINGDPEAEKCMICCASEHGNIEYEIKEIKEVIFIEDSTSPAMVVEIKEAVPFSEEERKAAEEDEEESK